MESILEFMYLGVTTFYQKRMNEFMNVAKSLETKEIGKDVEFDDEHSSKEEPHISETENNAEIATISESNTDSNIYRSKTSSNQRKLQNNSEGMFDCDQCESKYTQQGSLTRHIQSKHEGVKYTCNKCDHQATTQHSLKIHVQSRHEGVKHPCNQCNQIYTDKSSLSTHFKTKHEGFKYPCSYCKYQGNTEGKLTRHIQEKHE